MQVEFVLVRFEMEKFDQIKVIKSFKRYSSAGLKARECFIIKSFGLQDKREVVGYTWDFESNNIKPEVTKIMYVTRQAIDCCEGSSFISKREKRELNWVDRD
uniref:Uncharacterized protein n=1 Tax=Strigamia maritima TaxID=126957 RepID=T1IP26_STRMM